MMTHLSKPITATEIEWMWGIKRLTWMYYRYVFQCDSTKLIESMLPVTKFPLKPKPFTMGEWIKERCEGCNNSCKYCGYYFLKYPEICRHKRFYVFSGKCTLCGKNVLIN